MSPSKSASLLVAVALALGCGHGHGGEPSGPRTPAALEAAAGATTQSAAAGAAVPIAPAVRVLDGTGAPLSGVGVTFGVTAGGGAVSPATVVTNANGIATVTSWTLGTTAGLNTLQSTVGSLTPVTFSANAIAGPAAQLTKTSTDPQNAMVGTAVASKPSVFVKDAYGNAVAGATVTFAVTAGGGTVTGGSVVSSADGSATVGSWTVGTQPGSNTVSASVAGTTPVTFTATAVTGPPSQIVRASTDPQNATVGTAVASAPSVTVKDADGNPIAGVTVSFAVASGGGSLTGASATTSGAGVAAVGSWTLGTTSGTNTLTASVTGLTPVTFTATGVADAPASLAVTPASTALGVSGSQQLTPVVSDQYGNVVGTAAVSYSSASSGIAQVTSGGLVSGVAYGSTTITVSSGSLTQQVPVRVGTHPAGTSVVNVTETGQPYGIRISSQDVLLVTEKSAARVGRYDLPSTTLSTTIGMGSTPVDVDFSPDGAKAYVANSASSTLSIVTVATNTSTAPFSIPGNPLRVLVSKDGAYVYVTTSNGKIVRVTAATMALDEITPSGTLTGVALHPTKPWIYVAASEGGVYEIDLPSGQIVRTIATGGQPQDIAVSPDGSLLYVTDATGPLQVRSLSTLAVTSSVTAASGAFGAAISPDGAQLYVTRPAAGQTVVLDRTTLSVVKTITGTTPRRVTFDLNGTTAAIADEGNTVTVVK
jgi:adhesin/invasin